MHALVTGSTGFAGMYLVQHLIERGCSVYGTYLTKPSDPKVKGVQLLECDIRDATRLRRIMRRVRPRRIYHLAAFSSVQESFQDWNAVYEVNFWGTFNVLESARQVAPKARIMVVSSGECYGAVSPKSLPVTERHPFSPQSPYGLSKAAADMLANFYAHKHGLHVIRARPFNHTGPGQAPAFVCSDFARQIAAIDLGICPPLIRVGNLEVERDFSDVRDVVRAYELLLEKAQPGGAYNVASGKPTRLADIVRLLTSFSTRAVRVLTQRQRYRSGEAPTLYGSYHKLHQATNWKPQYTLRRTLFDLYQSWREKLQEQRN
jgi:GDP-4-dehydro-6-deoxy-D-mannose reductase